VQFQHKAVESDSFQLYLSSPGYRGSDWKYSENRS